MASARALEDLILNPIVDSIEITVEHLEEEQRIAGFFQVLEEAAASIGGFSYEWYCREVQGYRPLDPASYSIDSLLNGIADLPMHPSIALSALASSAIAGPALRRTGSFFSDFRLAKFLADDLDANSDIGMIVDPSAGTGVLLVAAALAVAGPDCNRLSEIVGSSICAADLSPLALRGASLALASLTHDQSAISQLITRIRQADSLLEGHDLWEDVAPRGFDAVIGNPPWEKLKISRHEHLVVDLGISRHYGDSYPNDIQLDGLPEEQQTLRTYIDELHSKYVFQGNGDPDLYLLFAELSFGLVRDAGKVLLLLPGGFIRSQGSERMRAYLLEISSNLQVTIIENRARFFPIDSRFKFLVVQADIDHQSNECELALSHATANADMVLKNNPVNISGPVLNVIRPDRSIPEVRTDKEWQLFVDMSQVGPRFGDQDGPWKPEILREVDMTRDRENFLRPEIGLPLIEGRMVHQYRHGSKRHIEGTGRAAIWEPTPANECVLGSQFSFPSWALSPRATDRVNLTRIGFCDITGQTNERSMLASRIPPGVVCGNKVPTILLAPSEDISHQQAELCWIAIANSFVFDWLLRRTVTTTVNYFVLLGVNMPPICLGGNEAKSLACLAGQISSCQHDGAEEYTPLDPWQLAELRAEIDWRVLLAYQQSFDALRLILDDFPLLDRAEPVLSGQKKSNITKDFLLLRAAEAFGEGNKVVDSIKNQYIAAREVGAVAYRPSQLFQDM